MVQHTKRLTLALSKTNHGPHCELVNAYTLWTLTVQSNILFWEIKETVVYTWLPGLSDLVRMFQSRLRSVYSSQRDTHTNHV